VDVKKVPARILCCKYFTENGAFTKKTSSPESFEPLENNTVTIPDGLVRRSGMKKTSSFSLQTGLYSYNRINKEIK